MYLLGLYAGYESTLRGISWHSGQSWAQRAIVRFALVSSFGLHGHDLGQLGPSLSRRLGAATTWTEARTAVKDQQRDDDMRRREDQRLARRLVDYAGVAGVDADGRRLDQREFDQTKSALRWLHTCHSGWWTKEGRYHQGLLDKIGGPNQMHDLDTENGYHERVSSDGRRGTAGEQQSPAGYSPSAPMDRPQTSGRMTDPKSQASHRAKTRSGEITHSMSRPDPTGDSSTR